jgi:hypothetical protein
LSRRILTTALCLLALGLGQTEAATVSIPYRLAKAGQVSLAVYDDKGVLVRELLRAVPQGAGDHVVTWDGLGQDRKPAQPGGYGWKLLETQGLSAEYLLSVGSNYPMGTNLSSSGGPGTHLAPFAVTSDPSGVYIAALQTENIESGLVKLSPDGRTRLWSQQLPADGTGALIPWEGALSVGSDGRELYLLGHLAPQRVYVSDAKSGQTRRTFTVDWEPPFPNRLGAGVTDGATGMAIARGAVVIAYAARGAISWYDAATGAHLATAHVPAPSGVATDRAGTVFVTTGDRTVRLTRARPRPVTLRSALAQPGAITVDPTTGDLLVFEGGERQQVLRLSPRGAIVRRYGLRGGRREGPYVAENLRDVSALAADGAGGFFVTEPYAAPRRVAHFDRSGAVVQEWYGGQPWGTGAAFEPGHPEAMWVSSAVGLDKSHWIMRVVIDYATRSWRVHSCYRYISSENPLMHGSGNEGNLFHLYQHAGTNYLAIEGGSSIWKIDETNWRLLPVTAFGAGFQWNDANGDGRVQETEKSPVGGRMHRTFLVPHLAENFDHFFVSNISEPCRIRRVPVTTWTAAGAPVYGGDPDGEIFADCPARFIGKGPTDPRWATFLHFDTPSGKLFGVFNPGTTGWCSSRDSFAQAWDAARRPSWQVGELGPASSAPRPGTYTTTSAGLIYWNLRGIAGVTHDCLVALDVDGGWASERAQTYVWDRDGLFVGGLMDHPKLDGIPEFMYHLGGELAHGTLFTAPDGDVIFAGNWESDVRLYRITGFDTAAAPWVRMSGSLGFSPTAAANP